MKNVFLTNPLETFKSFTYSFDFIQLSTPNKKILIDSFNHNFFYETEFNFETLFFFIFIPLLVFVNYNYYLKKTWNIYIYTFVSVIICQILFYPFAIQNFINTQIFFPEILVFEQEGVPDFVYKILIDLFAENIVNDINDTLLLTEIQGYLDEVKKFDFTHDSELKNFYAILEQQQDYTILSLIENFNCFEQLIDDIQFAGNSSIQEQEGTIFYISENLEKFAMFSVLFLKESISFFSLFILWWILANYSFSDTLLMPKTIIEILDEVLYRKNLKLFADTLQIKQNHEVRNYQEFFMKTHGILLFILIANVQGMVPYSSTITSSLINTFYISLAVFINIIITLLKEKGFAHFFSLFLPAGCPFNLIFLLNPIEFISYVFRLISLSVRLFANMMAGHTLLKVIAGFSWSLILLGDNYVIVHYIPFFVLFILTFLEIAVGFIQTYIFVILVYIYLSDIFMGH